MEIKFYKEKNDLWYVDLPEYIESGGTKEDCQMVAGADDWLDVLSQGESRVVLEIQTVPFDGANSLTMDELLTDAFGYGAYYKVEKYNGVDYPDLSIWLCPVTVYVFGEYPKTIYYR